MDFEKLSGILSTIVTIIKSIKSQIDTVKVNKKQCRRLYERIQIVEPVLKAINELDLPSENYILGIVRLQKCLKECEEFISQFTNHKRIKQFIKAKSNQEKFQDLTKELQGIAGLLNLGLVAQQLVNHEQDKKDQTEDNKQLQEMLTNDHQQMQQFFAEMQLQQSQLTELLQHYSKSLQQSSVRHEGASSQSLIDKHLIIPFCELEVQGVIEEGSLGIVYKGLWKSEVVAIKVVRSLDKDSRQEFEREVQIMSRLRSQTITQFYGACFEEDNECLVMEYMERGSLLRYLQQEGKQLTLKQRTELLLDVAKGLKYLHQNAILHRDLKSSNVLIDKNGHAKLADFGLAKIQSATVRTIEKTSQALAWMSPEVLNRSSEYTDKADIYSFGVICWEVLTGKVPPNQSAVEIKTARAILPIPDHIPELYKTLIQRCWDPASTARPKIDEIIKQLEGFNEEDALSKARELCQKGMDLEKAGHYQEALLNYEHSANLGYARAIGNVGIFTLKGLGGRMENKSAAAVLFAKAAEQGHARSQFNLGVMLADGDGVPQNIPQAIVWFEKAIAGGNTEAKSWLEKLKKDHKYQGNLQSQLTMA